MTKPIGVEVSRFIQYFQCLLTLQRYADFPASTPPELPGGWPTEYGYHPPAVCAHSFPMAQLPSRYD